MDKRIGKIGKVVGKVVVVTLAAYTLFTVPPLSVLWILAGYLLWRVK